MKDDLKKLLAIKMLSSGIFPDVKHLIEEQRFKNAERTGDDKARVGSSWKEYWKIFSQQDFPPICPFCGMPMSEDEVDGCHVKIKGGGLLGRWSEKEYIIPGHHKCNMQQDEEFVTQIAVEAVEAIEK